MKWSILGIASIECKSENFCNQVELRKSVHREVERRVEFHEEGAENRSQEGQV